MHAFHHKRLITADRRISVAFLLLSVSIVSFFSHVCLIAQTTQQETLADQGMFQYPDSLSVSNHLYDLSSVESLTLSSADIDSTFSNIADLAWLRPIAVQNRLILFGESHYYRTIDHLSTRMLFAVNTFDSYPFVSFEHEYSRGILYDHFVQIKDENEAREFLTEILGQFITTEEFLTYLEHIREWNLRHPQRLIHVGAHDIEHGYRETIDGILVPFFRQADPSFKIDPADISADRLDMLIEMLRGRLKNLDTTKTTPLFGCITKPYVETVLDNLLSFFNSRQYQFDYYRQRAILRNLTDERFHGRHLRHGKVFLHIGAYHAATMAYPEGMNLFREGSFFKHEFALTKGKTYSISAECHVFRFEPMATVDLDTCVRQGGLYVDRIGSFRRAYKAGLAVPSGFYSVWWSFDCFDSLMTAKAYQVDHRPMLLRSIRWESCIRNGASADQRATLSNERRKMEPYDAVIWVSRSDITRARSKAVK